MLFIYSELKVLYWEDSGVFQRLYAYSSKTCRKTGFTVYKVHKV